MITIALDTATDRCSVAASAGDRVLTRQLDGARQHNAAILGLIGELLHELGGQPRDISRVLVADGPGSFTGLRVAAAVAKALVWGRPEVTWSVAPSLLVRAFPHAPPAGGTVLALADALRGELYAAMWRFGAERVEPVLTPRTLAPAGLPSDADVVVGSVPLALREAVAAASGREPIVGNDALPDARSLLALSRLAGGVHLVSDPAHWEPTYGRPAEAQAVWERKHGQPLPTPTDRLG